MQGAMRQFQTHNDLHWHPLHQQKRQNIGQNWKDENQINDGPRLIWQDQKG